MKFILFLFALVSFSFSNDFTKNIHCDKTIDKEVFQICYDYDMNLAKFVSYSLYGDKVNSGNIKKRGSFYSEKNLDGRYKVKTDNYTHTGFDRGHLASDANFDYDPDILDKTYSMANIVPQYPLVNQKTWFVAEQYERSLASKKGKINVINIVEFNRPTPMVKYSFEEALNNRDFDDKKLASFEKKFYKSKEELADRNIMVPSGFYKILYDDKGFEECYYFPNVPEPSLKNILKSAKTICQDLK